MNTDEHGYFDGLTERLSIEPTAQCLNYLRVSGRSLCPLVRSESSIDAPPLAG